MHIITNKYIYVTIYFGILLFMYTKVILVLFSRIYRFIIIFLVTNYKFYNNQKKHNLLRQH